MFCITAADVKEEAAAAPLGPSSTKEEKPHAVKEEAGVGRAPDGAEVAADEGFEARTEAEEEGKNVKAKGEGSAKGPGSPALPELVPQGKESELKMAGEVMCEVMSIFPRREAGQERAWQQCMSCR